MRVQILFLVTILMEVCECAQTFGAYVARPESSALHAYPGSAGVGRVTLLALTRVAFYTSPASSNKTFDCPRDLLHRLLLVHATH